MNSKDIKIWQAEQVHESIGPTHRYLNRLRERLDKRGFERSDPFYLEVVAAQAAIHKLFISTHYLSCEKPLGPPGVFGK